MTQGAALTVPTVETFDPDRDPTPWHDLLVAQLQEARPNDPLPTLDETRRSIANTVAFAPTYRWWIRDPRSEQGLAHARLEWLTEGTNRHLGVLELFVRPEFRRRGFGRALTDQAIQAAREQGLTVLLSQSRDTVPAGAEFARSLGADEVQRVEINELDLRDLSVELMQSWIDRARERAVGYTLGWWEGPYPEPTLPDVVAMRLAENLIPRGGIRAEDQIWTEEQIRLLDEAFFARGNQRWTAYVRAPADETGSGVIAGFTEVVWKPERPEIVSQGSTAVFQAHQQLGLGRWLKAEMALRIIRELPEARKIRTGNAEHNEPMLKLNREQGFVCTQRSSVWQLKLNVPGTP